jgi:hypothetical protein
MLGIGRDAMRMIPSDGERRMRPEALRAAIERERGALFDRPEPVRSLGEALLEAAAKC